MTIINSTPVVCFAVQPSTAIVSRHAYAFRSILPRRSIAPKATRSFVRSCTNAPKTTQAGHYLEKAAESGGLDSCQITTLLHLTDLLLEVNKQFNLTAIRTRDAVIQKHIIDGLSLLPFIDAENATRIIDVGTGAGFPGLVLAIARPHLQLTLLDSIRKKTRFHDLACEKLELTNVSSVWARAEEAGQDAMHREQYQVTVARSVAEMRVLSELCMPFVSIGGCLIAQKSVDASRAEIKAAKGAMRLVGGDLESVSTDLVDMGQETDQDGREKAVIIVRKKRGTPRRYPRLSGTPKKTPL